LSRGLLLTFGVFQNYYETVLLRAQSSGSIAWISTTCAFIVLSAGVVTGPLYDRGYYKVLLVVGTSLEVFGLMMLSLSTKYYQLFLAQAICVGLGAGIVFTPSVAAAAACFTNPATRAKIMGLMAAMSSVGMCLKTTSFSQTAKTRAGGIIYPIMFRYLLPEIGFPRTVRSIAFIVMALYFISWAALLNELPKPPKVRRILDTSAFTDWPYMAICFASIFSSAAYYIPMLYIPTLTIVRIPSFSPERGFDLLAVINGASAVGRILIGLIAAAFGPTETITVSAALASVVLFCWIPVDTSAGIWVWAVFWGMLSGAIVALPGAFIPLFCPDISLIGTRNGMYWVWTAVGMLIGSPIAAAIYEPKSAEKGWWKLQVFSAVFMMMAAILSVYPSIHLRRRNRMEKLAT